MALIVSIPTTAEQDRLLRKFAAKNAKSGETLEEFASRVGLKGLHGYLAEEAARLEEHNIAVVLQAFKVQPQTVQAEVLTLLRCVRNPDTGVVTWLDAPALVPPF